MLDLKEDMNWLTDIIKHLTGSRSFTGAGALFFASLVLLFGPKIYPNYIETVPVGWSWAVLAVFLFTGFLIVAWTAQWGYKIIISFAAWVKHLMPLQQFNEEERALLYLLAKRADQPLNLEYLFHNADGQVSKLELLRIAGQLEQKGYVKKNIFEEKLISLTERGRAYALEVESEFDSKPVGESN
jgi:hypothetical protein